MEWQWGPRYKMMPGTNIVTISYEFMLAVEFCYVHCPVTLSDLNYSQTTVLYRATLYASTAFAVALFLTVCLIVCLSVSLSVRYKSELYQNG